DCTIRDLSDTGARIDLLESHILPKYFVLIDLRNGNAYEAELKWRTRFQIGISFVRSFALDGPLSPENLYLKRLWAGSFHGIDADVLSWRPEATVEFPAHKIPDQTGVTPEMVVAGV